MTVSMGLAECVATVDEDWEEDKRGKVRLTLDEFKDGLFQLADVWTDTVDVLDYVAFLGSVRAAISRPDGSGFLRDDEVQRGVARPPGYAEETDRERRTAHKAVVKSKFMQDAEAQAKERYEAAQKVQAMRRAQQAKVEAKERARVKELKREQRLEASLAASLGREPTAAEVAAARDERLLAELRASMGGREPTEDEVAAARERELRARLTAKNGSPPSDAELAAAQDAALRERLIAQLGREPTDAEMAAARDDELRVRLRRQLGREPTDEEMAISREAAVQEVLKGKLGRPPTLLEQEAAREEALIARLRAENGGKEPTEEQMARAREEAIKKELRRQLGREPTEEEVQQKARQREKLLLKLEAQGARPGRAGGLGGGSAHGGRSRSHATSLMAAQAAAEARRQRATELKRHAAAVLANQLHKEHMRALGLLPPPCDHPLLQESAAEALLVDAARRALLRSRYRSRRGGSLRNHSRARSRGKSREAATPGVGKERRQEAARGGERRPEVTTPGVGFVPADGAAASPVRGAGAGSGTGAGDGHGGSTTFESVSAALRRAPPMNRDLGGGGGGGGGNARPHQSASARVGDGNATTKVAGTSSRVPGSESARGGSSRIGRRLQRLGELGTPRRIAYVPTADAEGAAHAPPTANHSSAAAAAAATKASANGVAKAAALGHSPRARQRALGGDAAAPPSAAAVAAANQMERNAAKAAPRQDVDSLRPSLATADVATAAAEMSTRRRTQHALSPSPPPQAAPLRSPRQPRARRAAEPDELDWREALRLGMPLPMPMPKHASLPRKPPPRPALPAAAYPSPRNGRQQERPPVPPLPLLPNLPTPRVSPRAKLPPNPSADKHAHHADLMHAAFGVTIVPGQQGRQNLLH